MASVRRIDPLFAYAMVKLESNFDPRARTGEARGLMQIKPGEWRAVSDMPYETASWDWRSNLAVGMDSLASIKRVLEAKGVFSYPMLWASYHYGLDYTEAHGFDMSRVRRPSDPVSYKLWAGDIHPVAPPQ
jgi:soluble lytic murein transglycosylase-like protein